jgi:hypothetical protein
MAAACGLDVKLGKLMYPGMFGGDPTFVYMSCSPNESYIPKQQRKNMYLWYTVGRKMSDKNLRKQININFCVQIG